MVFGMAVSVANAKIECIDANGNKVNSVSAKDFMTSESQKAKYEKLKKEVEEILQIKGQTREQAKDYDYVKFLNGLEMLQKSDRCINWGNGRNISVLLDYKDKNNDEYYFYGAEVGSANGWNLDYVYRNLLGDDFSGKSGELGRKKIQARQNSYSKGVWLESTGGK